ncbi:hypothetical protein [Anabaena sp. CCY 0017]|uniref:hypothetical protein n=1 Tax=Anabaena sp. CCY 0017 TaxID=3103866 RepID=UPI0039C66528
MSEEIEQILEERRAKNNLSHQQVTLEFYKLLIENDVKAGAYLADPDKMIQAWQVANFFLSNYAKMEVSEVYGYDVSDAFEE